jgi:hypothetical protein
LKLRRDKSKNVIPQIEKIKIDGFLAHYGLSENNILIRNHKKPNLNEKMVWKC